jgi:hypothetical protein
MRGEGVLHDLIVEFMEVLLRQMIKLDATRDRHKNKIFVRGSQRGNQGQDHGDKVMGRDFFGLHHFDPIILTRILVLVP